MTDARKQKLKKALMQSRFRLLKINFDFASPLQDMIFVATKSVSRVSTNGKCIYFDPDWLQRLDDVGLDFMLSHQLMHIWLGHIGRPKYYAGDRFHLACDIVVNAKLSVLGWNYDKLPHIGKIYCKTFFPELDGDVLTAQRALKCIPFDPAELRPGVRRNYMIDSEEWWDAKDDRGQSGEIVLGPDDKAPDDLLFKSTVGGKRFHVEKEEYEPDQRIEADSYRPIVKNINDWDFSASDDLNSLRSMKKRDESNGVRESFAERVWLRVDCTGLDWRKLLNTFVGRDLRDYSFTPPDRRYQDSDFFMPDYNVQKERPKNVMLFVDTSASVDDKMLNTVYSEILTLLSQFDGGVLGTLLFFDTHIRHAVKIGGISDLKDSVPHGGGATDFNCIFDYVKSLSDGDFPDSIVIFTDGEASFPDKPDITTPILWIFTKNKTAP